MKVFKSRYQNSNLKQISKHNQQNSKPIRIIGVWILVFICHLEFGAWDLSQLSRTQLVSDTQIDFFKLFLGHNKIVSIAIYHAK